MKFGGGGIIKTAFSQKLLNTSSGHLDGKEIVLTCISASEWRVDVRDNDVDHALRYHSIGIINLVMN